MDPPAPETLPPSPGMRTISAPLQTPLQTPFQTLYTAYCIVLFVAFGMGTLVINLFVPKLRRRRQVAGAFSRGFLRMVGIPFTVHGAGLLPQAPCVVVANHASYIDGIIAIAALPPDFAFVIKKEMVRVPLAGLPLPRLGSQFLERLCRHNGAAENRPLLRPARSG